jgi:hypothetical protein
MRSLILVLPSVVLAFLSWGVYGPVLHEGQHAMGVPLAPSSLRPFICVGIAYFVIAVVVPMAMLGTKGERGTWKLTGAIWSFAAGAAGAIGALGIIVAFKFRGNPIYVMPLVFGLAPVVNTLFTMAMTRTFRQASAVFFGGIIVVAIGAAGVMFFKPVAKNVTVATSPDGSIKVTLKKLDHAESGVSEWTTKEWSAKNLEELKTRAELDEAYRLYLKKQPLTLYQFSMVMAAVALTALCWGSYGPVLHKGQAKMDGSRLRPLLCVGLAYFVIAVLAPLPLLTTIDEPGRWTLFGVMWSLGAGAAGAIGALGIIMAFNFGGKPIYVMPLVFGCAPVVNTLTTIASEGTAGQVTALFFVSLMLVIAGAVAVLVFAPRSEKKAVSEEEKGTPGQRGSEDEGISEISDSSSGDLPKSRVLGENETETTDSTTATSAPGVETGEETVDPEETIDHRPQ